MGSAVTSARLDAGELELLKQDIAAEHEESNQHYQYTTLENSHYNAFRDHMMGQPIKGEADNLSNLTVDDLRNY